MPGLEKAKVFDASALIAYFEGDSGCDKVREIFKKSEKERSPLFLSVINWGEVLYATERKYGPHKKEQIEEMIDQSGLEVVPVERNLTRHASHFKNQYCLGYADAFVFALALEKKADLITADKDFQTVENKVNVIWV